MDDEIDPRRALDPLTYDIIGAAIDVHRYWGPGYLERVYHKSLEIELQLRGLDVQREIPFPLAYRGVNLGTNYRADMICGNVLVEVKAHSGIHDADIAQVVHYLRSSGLGRGLLLNFGLPALQKRRVIVGDNSLVSAVSVGSVPTPNEGTTT
ncbi:MAG: GxxExxY protein [Candidatus Thermoplasmatota archaeon]